MKTLSIQMLILEDGDALAVQMTCTCNSAPEGTIGSCIQAKCTTLPSSHKDSPKRKLYSLLVILHQGKGKAIHSMY